MLFIEIAVAASCVHRPTGLLKITTAFVFDGLLLKSCHTVLQLRMMADYHNLKNPVFMAHGRSHRYILWETKLSNTVNLGWCSMAKTGGADNLQVA